MPKIRDYIRKPLTHHFESEREFSAACVRLFKTGEGKKVLEHLILDCDYHIPDSYSLHQAKYHAMTWRDFLTYRAGQKEVIAHLLFAYNADYELKESSQTLTNEEDYD